MSNGIGIAARTALTCIALLCAGFASGSASAQEPGQRDLRVAANAEDYALTHWGDSYGGYWVENPFADDGDERIFFFAFRDGLRHKTNVLAKRFPLEASRYRPVLNRYSWNFLLKKQKSISRDARLLKAGKLKAPGEKPWEVGSYPDPQRDCVAVERYPLKKAWVKWAKKRWGASVCLDEVASGW